MAISLRALGCGLLAVALAGCAVQTPAARIERNPEMFAGLPEEHRALVEQGRIERGMSPDAVFLAWGNPDRRSVGEDGDVPTMRWDYAGLRPVYTTGFYGGYGYGGWRYPYGRGCGSPYYAFSPQVTYLPEQRASVLFHNSRVHSWEHVR